MPQRRAMMPRRTLLALFAGTASLALSRQALAQRKMTKQQAQYQDEPKGILMCETCTLFVRPASCKVVEGDVAASGWCNAFDLAD